MELGSRDRRKPPKELQTKTYMADAPPMRRSSGHARRPSNAYAHHNKRGQKNHNHTTRLISFHMPNISHPRIQLSSCLWLSFLSIRRQQPCIYIYIYIVLWEVLIEYISVNVWFELFVPYILDNIWFTWIIFKGSTFARMFLYKSSEARRGAAGLIDFEGPAFIKDDFSGFWNIAPKVRVGVKSFAR